MAEIAARELRNDTGAVLRRAEAGEKLTVTVRGRPVAVIGPLEERPRWLRREEFVRRFGRRQADPGLREDLQELLADTTEDLPAR